MKLADELKDRVESGSGVTGQYHKQQASRASRRRRAEALRAGGKRVQISVTGRHGEVPADIREYVEQKTARLPRYYDRVHAVEVVLNREGDHTLVEMIVKAAGTQEFIAKELGPDARSCIDLLVDKLERQLTKHKEKFRNRKHPEK